MQKFWKIFEYGYLLVAIVFFVEAILNWGNNRSYLLLLLSGVALFMYFFKKRFRKRIEEKNKNK